jgi:AraC family transcriptional regulator, transcriptional activator of pobA
VRELSIDSLTAAGPPLQVAWLRDASFGEMTERGARTPHRHDYHELIWTREGSGLHCIDGKPSAVTARTLTVIGRGQIHVFARGEGLWGAVVRFGDQLLDDRGVAALRGSWAPGASAPPSVPVPAGEVGRLQALIEMLATESGRPPDGRSLDAERHLLAVLVLWLERWQDATRTERHDGGDPSMALYRRFIGVLERDFARHGDAAHYADALHVPQAALARALTAATGHATKQLVTERRMLEAERLLRFSELTVGELAFRAGFSDPLYFSRAFKRRHGESPSEYRARGSGP